VSFIVHFVQSQEEIAADVRATSRDQIPQANIDMVEPPTLSDLDDFERDPVASIFMLHDLFGDDRLLEPPGKDMTPEEEEEYKAYCLDQCTVSPEEVDRVMSRWRSVNGHRYVLLK
jgi:hypothetical protein